jgi:hypothetical protein
MKQKLMTAMEERDAGKPKMSGRVELDDAYLSGVRSGRKRGPIRGLLTASLSGIGSKAFWPSMVRPARRRSWRPSRRASTASRGA